MQVSDIEYLLSLSKILIVFIRCLIFMREYKKGQNLKKKLEKQHTKNMTLLSGHALKCLIYSPRNVMDRTSKLHSSIK